MHLSKKSNCNTKNTEVENKIPIITSLGNTAVLNAKVAEIENKISNTSNLVKKAYYNAKITKTENKITNHDKLIITPDTTSYHNFLMKYFIKK